MFLQSSPLSSSVVRMEFGREVFHDGLEPLDASRLAQGEKVCCATPAFHIQGCLCFSVNFLLIFFPTLLRQVRD